MVRYRTAGFQGLSLYECEADALNLVQISTRPPPIQIEGLSTLTALRKISIQSNRLEAITGLEHCTSLEELYLSHNGIGAIEVRAG